jgi:hypothetical protein
MSYLTLICFVRMDFSEQYNIKGEARDKRCDKMSISTKTFIEDLER